MRAALGMILTGACALAACGERAAPPQTATETARTGTRYLMADGEADGFARAIERRPFVFPRDHGSHPEYRIEWWYFTGNLRGESTGGHYGFELTFFRVGLAPEPRARASAWATNEIWMAHFAITDTANRKFIADERLTRAALGLAGAELGPFRVWVEGWSARGGDDIPPLTLRAGNDEAALELELSASKPPVLQGDEGLDPKGPEPGNASYYYSYTRLEARGTIAVADRSETVRGLAWMDREWSTSVLGPDLEGWDWFALQLDDGRDLMFYRLRHHDGTASPYSGGSLVDRSGRRQALGPDDVELEAVRSWSSPASGARYPVAWRLRVPHEGLALDIEPYLDEQEMDLFVRYWEGAVRVTGTVQGSPIGGSGYLELAGY